MMERSKEGQEMFNWEANTLRNIKYLYPIETKDIPDRKLLDLWEESFGPEDFLLLCSEYKINNKEK